MSEIPQTDNCLVRPPFFLSLSLSLITDCSFCFTFIKVQVVTIGDPTEPSFDEDMRNNRELRPGLKWWTGLCLSFLVVSGKRRLEPEHQEEAFSLIGSRSVCANKAHERGGTIASVHLARKGAHRLHLISRGTCYSMRLLPLLPRAKSNYFK